ncbi:MAG: diphthine--ammonia ligase [Halobacteriaceae archaeon]
MSWVSLFSGGKDSSWALHQALSTDREVSHLLTVHPSQDSYMYHVPATDLAGLAAESIGRPLVEVTAEDLDATTAVDAGAQGDREVEPLEATLRSLAAETTLDGLIVGAVESEFQNSRIQALADRLDIDVFAPLWGADPATALREMVAGGFEIRLIQVAARGLGREWLGRTIDTATIADLEALAREHGVHVLGEGGEFETLVTDGPHMSRRLEYEAEPIWEGTRGHLRITDAWLSAEDD